MLHGTIHSICRCHATSNPTCTLMLIPFMLNSNSLARMPHGPHAGLATAQHVRPHLQVLQVWHAAHHVPQLQLHSAVQDTLAMSKDLNEPPSWINVPETFGGTLIQ